MMTTDQTRAQIIQRLRDSRTILAITHARPDGDGLGCLSALRAALQTAGKTVHLLMPDTMPQRYAFLFDAGAPAGAAELPALAGRSDLIVIADTCAFNQLDSLEATLRASRDKIVVIDHHLTADDISSTCWIDSSAAAAGILVAELLEEMGLLAASPAAAHALATAITSDTGWLRYSNTDARCLGVMQRLLALGVRMDKLYAQLYQGDRPQRVRLLAKALSSLELHHGDSLAVMELRKEDFAASGASADETENFVNEALRIGCVESALLLVEQGDLVRVSLRSREHVDVAAIAKKFGGGGHARAAGLRSSLPLAEIKQQLIAEFAAVAS